MPWGQCQRFVRGKWFIQHRLFHTYQHSKSHKHHNPCAFSLDIIVINIFTSNYDFIFSLCLILCSKFDRQHFNRQTTGTRIFRFVLKYFTKRHNCRSRAIKRGIQYSIENITCCIYLCLMLCVNKIFNLFLLFFTNY